MTANDFISARTLRRTIIKQLKDQQCLDSICSEKLRITISKHTRKILEMISHLLMGFAFENMNTIDRVAFEKIAHPSLSVENWFKLRKEEASSATEIARLGTLLRNAEAEYDRYAPLGFISGWFSNKVEDQKIEAAKSRRNLLRAQRESEENVHRSKVEAIQGHATLFLRNAMSKDGLRSLLNSSSISKQLQEALCQMTKEVTAVWSSHIRNQTDSLEKVRAPTADLFGMYDREDVSDSTPLVRGKYASAIN